MFCRVRIRDDEIGLLFRHGSFRGLLTSGVHWFAIPRWRHIQVDVVSLRAPQFVHEQLYEVVESGALNGRATVCDLKDHQRGLVWIDGRFSHILSPGLFAFWTDLRDVEVQIVDARQTHFEHKELDAISKSPLVEQLLDLQRVEAHHKGVLFLDGHYVATLPPGLYAFWKSAVETRLVSVDQRECLFDVGGQDLITADKVSLRINAQTTFRVEDVRRAVAQVEDFRQTLYRETQMALRAVIGSLTLDELLANKQAIGVEVRDLLAERSEQLGVQINAVGVRDIILPGEMKLLMNQVTEAKKAAEANLITRREEVAALRSQANAAKLLTDHPTLMRLRELEVLQKIASAGNLQVVLGESGLTDRLVKAL